MHRYLQSKEVDTIILMGMQSEYCIDTTCKVAFELWYTLYIVKGSTSTFTTNLCTGEQLTKYFEEHV